MLVRRIRTDIHQVYPVDFPLPSSSRLSDQFELLLQRNRPSFNVTGGPHSDCTIDTSKWLRDRIWDLVQVGGGTRVRCGALIECHAVSRGVRPQALPQYISSTKFNQRNMCEWHIHEEAVKIGRSYDEVTTRNEFDLLIAVITE
ncbi:hypothetical protein AC579_4331 [Pseudocercospora musae]|uniref:Uncharacterized protein n=1 Tax=Pseudocercospora musae TaxID=113226 RepID=A0A139IQI0_9PEZI|nr:hypothetical protein AC579_4331 [Pseudocercospora musae]